MALDILLIAAANDQPVRFRFVLRLDGDRALQLKVAAESLDSSSQLHQLADDKTMERVDRHRFTTASAATVLGYQEPVEELDRLPLRQDSGLQHSVVLLDGERHDFRWSILHFLQQQSIHILEPQQQHNIFLPFTSGGRL